MIQANCSKKTSNSLEKYVFFVCFSPLLCPRANRSYRSLLSCSFLKSNESDLLMLLFKKSNFERIAPVTLYKRAMGAICSFSQGNHSFAFRSQRIFTGESLFCFSLTKNFHRGITLLLFAHKERAICSKYWWANSKPYIFLDQRSKNLSNPTSCRNIPLIYTKRYIL